MNLFAHLPEIGLYIEIFDKEGLLSHVVADWLVKKPYSQLDYDKVWVRKSPNGRIKLETLSKSVFLADPHEYKEEMGLSRLPSMDYLVFDGLVGLFHGNDDPPFAKINDALTTIFSSDPHKRFITVPSVRDTGSSLIFETDDLELAIKFREMTARVVDLKEIARKLTEAISSPSEQVKVNIVTYKDNLFVIHLMIDWGKSQQGLPITKIMWNEVEVTS